MPKPLVVNPSAIFADYSQFNFASADEFYWSAERNTVYYNPKLLHQPAGLYRLLHEIGHAVSGHKTFKSGVALLAFEVEAWQVASEISQTYGITIPNEHIDACLETYRDWLHKRSICPNCQTISVEVDENQYHCFNCSQKWQVPTDQRSRCYRMKLTTG